MFCSSASSYHEVSPDTSGETSWYNEATGVVDGVVDGAAVKDGAAVVDGVVDGVVDDVVDGAGLGQIGNRVGGKPVVVIRLLYSTDSDTKLPKSARLKYRLRELEAAGFCC